MKKIALLAFLTIPFSLHAVDEIKKVPIIKDKKMEELKIEYNLTQEQQDKIKASQDKYKPIIEEKEALLKFAEDKFSEAINNPDSSTEDLSKLFQEKSDAENALHLVYFQSRMELRDILTLTQRSKMIAKYKQTQKKSKKEVKAPPEEIPVEHQKNPEWGEPSIDGN